MKKSLSIFCIILIAFSNINCLELSISDLEKSDNFKMIDVNARIADSNLMQAESKLGDGEPDENIIDEINEQY